MLSYNNILDQKNEILGVIYAIFKKYKKGTIKWGSTKNFLKRMAHYITPECDFDNDSHRIWKFVIRKSKYDCYMIDNILQYCSKTYSFPYEYYNGTGGNEHYEFDNDIEKIFAFFELLKIEIEDEDDYEIDVNELREKIRKKNYEDIGINFDKEEKIKKCIGIDNEIKDLLKNRFDPEIFEDILVQLRDYQLEVMEKLKEMYNDNDIFKLIWSCGLGKSKIVELLKYTFGEYFGSVQSQLFTRPRPDANSPDPGLLSLMKKKLVIASEPEKNNKLNSGFIKFITGRDSTTLRNCHSNDMIEFTANFITLLICNDIPDCDDIDNAFSKRLRCINFPTEFVTEPKKENQKKIDVNINKNFDFWKLDFMLLLIEKYKKYIETHELKPTENILKWTNQYQEDTDMYLQFINECTEDSETHTHTSDLYETFKTWFKINNPNTKIPSNKEFMSNIKKYKNIERFYFNQKQRFGIKNLKIINFAQNDNLD